MKITVDVADTQANSVCAENGGDFEESRWNLHLIEIVSTKIILLTFQKCTLLGITTFYQRC